MALNRDLSVLLVRDLCATRGRELDVADVLAGTGARSVRLANEVDAPLQVHGNDADPKAIQAAAQAAKANGVEDRVHLHEGPAHAFLASRRFDVVDIDPYGPPTPFLDAGVAATRHNGLLCLTATDTGALSGTYPRVCRRRYGAHHGLHKAPWRAEVGLRILAGAAVRAAGRFDRVATPVLSVSGGHWMRVVLRIQDGRKDADAGMRRLGDAVLDDGRGIFAERGAHWAGPLWTGPLHEAAVVTRMAADEAPMADPRTKSLVETLVDEADAPAFWLDMGELRRRFQVDAPRRSRFMEAIQDAGHVATRTHIEPQGVRTDAPWDVLRDCWTARP